MKISKSLILTGVLTTILIIAGSNQIFLKTPSAAIQQQQQLKNTNNTSKGIKIQKSFIFFSHFAALKRLT
jgi:hypothetical protein